DARMAEGQPMEALAEEAPGMRWRRVVVGRERPPLLLCSRDMREIAALGRIEAQQQALRLLLLLLEAQRDLAAIAGGEAPAGHAPARKMILGEFGDAAALDK